MNLVMRLLNWFKSVWFGSVSATTIFHEGFESDAGWHHNVKIFPANGEPYDAEKGNLFVPKNWLFFFWHEPGSFDQPEARHAWSVIDPRRIHTGNGAYTWFSFHRRHNAGLMRQVQVECGAKLRLTAWMTAWSNGCNVHLSDAKWSDGSLVGYEEVTLTPGDIPSLNGDEQSDANGNSAQAIGIDPTGGTDPYAESVVWSNVQYTYNNYVEQSVIEAVAESNTVTVFIRDVRLWAFRHNDFYVDDVTLEVIEGPEPPPPPPPPPPPDDGFGIRYSPETPLLRDRITVEVLSGSPFTHVPTLLLALDCEYVETVVSDEYHIARYLTSPAIYSGHYDMYVDGELLGGFYVPGDAPPPPPVIPLPPPPPPLPDGLPRVQYPRIYYLLPPGAGAAWAKAIVDAVWESQRPTVGASADDAGLGALDDKTVIVINPQGWE